MDESESGEELGAIPAGWYCACMQTESATDWLYVRHAAKAVTKCITYMTSLCATGIHILPGRQLLHVT